MLQIIMAFITQLDVFVFVWVLRFVTNEMHTIKVVMKKTVNFYLSTLYGLRSISFQPFFNPKFVFILRKGKAIIKYLLVGEIIHRFDWRIIRYFVLLPECGAGFRLPEFFPQSRKG